MPGPARRPIEEKYRLGNPGKRPLPDRSKLVPLPGLGDNMPVPHRPLGPQGKQLWERIWKSGAVWLARNVDCEVVLVLCEQMDERQALRLEVFKDKAAWRQRSQLRALEKSLLYGLAQLAFNPVERGKLGVAEVKNESTLDRLRRERQG